MRRAEITLTQDLAEIARLNDWLAAECAASGLAATVAGDLKLCLDEAVTNVISYGRAEDGAVSTTVDLVVDAAGAMATISDTSFAYDPLSRAEAQKITSLADAHIGGFGISLIRSTASQVAYRRADGRNVFTIACGDAAHLTAAQAVSPGT